MAETQDFNDVTNKANEELSFKDEQYLLNSKTAASLDDNAARAVALSSGWHVNFDDAHVVEIAGMYINKDNLPDELKEGFIFDGTADGMRNALDERIDYYNENYSADSDTRVEKAQEIAEKNGCRVSEVLNSFDSYGIILDELNNMFTGLQKYADEPAVNRQEEQKLDISQISESVVKSIALTSGWQINENNACKINIDETFVNTANLPEDLLQNDIVYDGTLEGLRNAVNKAADYYDKFYGDANTRVAQAQDFADGIVNGPRASEVLNSLDSYRLNLESLSNMISAVERYMTESIDDRQENLESDVPRLNDNVINSVENAGWHVSEVERADPEDAKEFTAYIECDASYGNYGIPPEGRFFAVNFDGTDLDFLGEAIDQLDYPCDLSEEAKDEISNGDMDLGTMREVIDDYQELEDSYNDLYSGLVEAQGKELESNLSETIENVNTVEKAEPAKAAKSHSGPEL